MALHLRRHDRSGLDAACIDRLRRRWDRDSVTRRSFALIAAVLALPLAAHGETYRWVDARGGVTYGDAPPPGAREVRRLDEAAGRVSTIPAAPVAARQRDVERALEARVEQLERELHDLRAAQPVAVPVVVPQPVFSSAPLLVGAPFVVGPPFFAQRPRFVVRGGPGLRPGRPGGWSGAPGRWR